jgi:type VI secretion system protein ImpK
VSAATTLLSLVSQLRDTPSHPDPAGLETRVVQEIQNFETKARNQGASPETVVAARYALCTVLDETVLSTPWGGQSAWSTRSLLSIFHRETWGGEKFFQVLERLEQDPARNIDLLELLYICLALGFLGKYRVDQRGAGRLAEIRDNLYRTIRMTRGTYDRELAVRWRGVEDKRNPIVRYVPFWVVAAVAGFLMIGSFLYFRINLSGLAEPAHAQLSQIGTEYVPMVVAPASEVRLAELLIEKEQAGRIARGQIVVDERSDRTVVLISGDNLFSSGSAEVNEGYHALLAEVGDAINQVTGPVQVVGHTDNVPIRSFRFQNNYELSRARATDVARILSQTVSVPSRLVPNGVADTQPLFSNDTPANRARNRRVEIIHHHQAEQR